MKASVADRRRSGSPVAPGDLFGAKQSERELMRPLIRMQSLNASLGRLSGGSCGLPLSAAIVRQRERREQAEHEHS